MGSQTEGRNQSEGRAAGTQGAQQGLLSHGLLTSPALGPSGRILCSCVQTEIRDSLTVSKRSRIQTFPVPASSGPAGWRGHDSDTLLIISLHLKAELGKSQVSKEFCHCKLRPLNPVPHPDFLAGKKTTVYK